MSGFSFDEGGENAGIRKIIYDGPFFTQLENFAKSYRKEEAEINNQLNKDVEAAEQKAEKARNTLQAQFKKKLKITINTSLEN